MPQKRVLLFGSTGSIGTSTDQVVRNLHDELQLVAAGSNWAKLLDQIRVHRPEAVGLSDFDACEQLTAALAKEPFEAPRVYAGPRGLVEMARDVDGEILVAAVSGAAGLEANLAALESGKDLALANKESLVMSGALLMEHAAERGRAILPVDSEHNAIFQSLRSGERNEVSRLILTASGGPFRTSSAEDLRAVTVKQALKHPNWDMGAKITIDSATLMNKALEVIEARWLFDMAPEQIDVVIHPQSIIHSLVEYRDGSTICQLGPPDMKVPIQYALTFPDRRPLPVERVDLATIGALTFEELDRVRFPALRLAYEVLERGGTAPTVLNASNEIAREAFLDGHISFLSIVDTVEECLGRHSPVSQPGMSELFEADEWARAEARRIIASGANSVTSSGLPAGEEGMDDALH